ncbi:hypothetical protein BU17DRAFT_49369 [Hysterangium stoloniferum]|nr:hypothetical protein BU17DRAFT_49369 [Hysterangium stoloniferum]
MSLQDNLASESQFLSPHNSSSRQTLSTRRSKQSLLGDNATRGASLAHELAAALMPEPSAGSRLLADEFGIEFDEGAEGVDDDGLAPDDTPPEVVVSEDMQFGSTWETTGETLAFIEPSSSKTTFLIRQTLQDPLTVLSQDLNTTDLFIENLRRMDTDPTHSSPYPGSSTFEPPLERLASDYIRRINESAREREGQVRELREFEKEFKRIAGQAGGTELLSELEELDDMDAIGEEPKEKELKTEKGLQTVEEEEELTGRRDTGVDWELDPHRVLGDDEAIDYGDPYRPDQSSPVKETSPMHPPPLSEVPTPASTVTQLTYMRSMTQSLVQSLSTVVEHTQVTGAATAEAGRKIRALKNKLGGWRADSESAERSMDKIEKWEAAGGINSVLSTDGKSEIPNGIGQAKERRRLQQIMQEELSAFELVLAEAGRKTQAIMAAS